MANQNQKNGTTEQNVDQQVQNQAPVNAEPQNGQQQTTETTEQKGGFGAWCKRHWKGLVAGVTGALAVGGSAVVAYKKGKQAGVASVPPQMVEPEDYSLNPNE